MAKMSKMSILSIVSIALALFVGSLSAQAQMPATTTGGSSTAGGSVVSWSATSLVLETAAGDEMTFVVDSQNILPSDIAAGSRIEVTYDTLADGSYRASRISLYDGNPTPAPAVSTGSSTVPTSDSTAAPELTLITCYPFTYAGTAPYRYVVRGLLLSSAPRRQGGLW